MTDQVLDILKLVLLALLYLFFARVLWAVWSEVRQPAEAGSFTDTATYEGTPTAGTTRSWRTNTRTSAPPRGRRDTPARLVVIEPKERRDTVFALGDDAITIGREPTNTIVIADDAYVSSHHATVSRLAGNIVVDDAGSKNGTYLNGSRIAQQRTVHTGDRVQIGATVLEAQ